MPSAISWMFVRDWLFVIIAVLRCETYPGKGTRSARCAPDGFRRGRCRYTATLAIGLDPYNGSIHEHAQNQQRLPAHQLHSPLPARDTVRSTRPKYLC